MAEDEFSTKYKRSAGRANNSYKHFSLRSRCALLYFSLLLLLSSAILLLPKIWSSRTIVLRLLLLVSSKTVNLNPPTIPLTLVPRKQPTWPLTGVVVLGDVLTVTLQVNNRTTPSAVFLAHPTPQAWLNSLSKALEIKISTICLWSMATTSPLASHLLVPLKDHPSTNVDPHPARLCPPAQVI